VGHAHAHNLCGNERHTGLNPNHYGWTTPEERRKVIEDFGGVYKDVHLFSDRAGIEKWSDTLAWTLVDGNGVLLSIHIAPGWNWPEGFARNLENHIINPTAAMYDLRSIQLLGFFANDGNRERGGTYFPGELIEQATDAASNSTIQIYHINLPEHPIS